MRLQHGLALALAVLVNAGCEQTTAPTASPTSGTGVASAGGRGSGLPIVALAITVSDLDGGGSPYHVQSDGGGAYINGADNVSAKIDQYGNLALNTASSGAARRSLSFNFSNPVDPGNSFRPTTNPAANMHVVTVAPIPLQNLGVNGNPDTECAQLSLSFFGSSAGQFRVSFRKGEEDHPASPTAYGVIKRTSVSPAEWTITPAGSCTSNQSVASLRVASTSGKPTLTLKGYYHLPLLFTLRQQ